MRLLTKQQISVFICATKLKGTLALQYHISPLFNHARVVESHWQGWTRFNTSVPLRDWREISYFGWQVYLDIAQGKEKSKIAIINKYIYIYILIFFERQIALLIYILIYINS